MEEIICDKCGAHNPITQLYCGACNAKLDYSGFKAVSAVPDKKAKRQKRSGAEAGSSAFAGSSRQQKPESNFSIMSAVRIVIFLLLVAALGLLVWRVTPGGQAGNEDNAIECNRKLLRLEDGAKKKLGESATFAENEVNGFLAQIVTESAEKGGGQGGHLDLSEINVRFTQHYVIATIIAQIGPVKLSYELMLKPEVGKRLAESEIVQARFGHLKLPGGAKQWMAKRMMRVFEGRPREIFVMKNTVVSGIKPGKIGFTVKPE